MANEKYPLHYMFHTLHIRCHTCNWFDSSDIALYPHTLHIQLHLHRNRGCLIWSSHRIITGDAHDVFLQGQGVHGSKDSKDEVFRMRLCHSRRAKLQPQPVDTEPAFKCMISFLCYNLKLTSNSTDGIWYHGIVLLLSFCWSTNLW